MAESTRSPVKVQVFPKQRLKGMPQGQDVELTVVPKQVIRFQGLTVDDSPPKLTVTVDASGKSKLHYTPADCRAGTEACFEGPGLQELWVPQATHPTTRINISGLSSPFELRIPRALYDTAQPLKIVMGEIPGKPSLPYHSAPAKPPGFPEVPEDIEDFYIAMADNTRVLEGSSLQEGGHTFSDLSDLQKQMLLSLIKEVVAAGGALLDEKDLLRDFGLEGKFYLKKQGGKTFVIFKGYAGLRRIFKGTRYWLDKNYARLSILTIAQGPLQGAKMGLPKPTKGTMVGFLFMGVVNTWAWLVEGAETRFVSDLLIELGSDAVKSIIAGVSAAAMIAFGILVLELTAPVILVVGGTVLIGMAIGLGLDFLDGKIGITDSIKVLGRKAEGGVKDYWEELVADPLSRFLQRCEWELKNAYGIPGG